MSKTTPVRWWRDDATRYMSRGEYKAPRHDPTVEWAWHLMLKPIEPVLWQEIDMYRAFVLGEVPMGPGLLEGTGWRYCQSPIEDIRRGLCGPVTIPDGVIRNSGESYKLVSDSPPVQMFYSLERNSISDVPPVDRVDMDNHDPGDEHRSPVR